MDEDQLIIRNITKTSSTYKKITIYRHPLIIDTVILCNTHSERSCRKCRNSNNMNNQRLSLIKTKIQITDYILSNDFQYFFTFTFDPKKIDSTNFELVKSKMTNWLSNERKKSPNLKYLLVPEYHKKYDIHGKRAIHFHLLIAHYSPSMYKTRYKSKSGKTVYNVTNWKYGHSTAVETDHKYNLASYMTKYITKEVIADKNKKRYWVSRNCDLPVKSYNVDPQQYIKDHSLQHQFTNEEISIYNTNTLN